MGDKRPDLGFDPRYLEDMKEKSLPKIDMDKIKLPDPMDKLKNGLKINNRTRIDADKDYGVTVNRRLGDHLEAGAGVNLDEDQVPLLTIKAVYSK